MIASGSTPMYAADFVDEPTESHDAFNRPKTHQEHLVLRILTGCDAGTVVELSDDSYVLGRARSADIRITCQSVSRAHAIIKRDPQGLTIEDLGSRNGTYVDDERISGSHALREGQRITIGSSVMRLALLDDEELTIAHSMAEAARRDPLTQCFNRAYFDQRLSSELARAEKKSCSLSVVMIDLDYFKRINDQYGHLAGDQILRSVGYTLLVVTRAEDVVARFGGEEFAVIMPGATLLGAAVLAQRLRIAIEQMLVHVDGHELRATASLGVATLEVGQIGTPVSLLRAADDALYAAKREGRNRVHVGQVDPSHGDDTGCGWLVTLTIAP